MDQIRDAMAAVIWKAAGGTGQYPTAPYKAANDLASLYEEGNDKPLKKMLDVFNAEMTKIRDSGRDPEAETYNVRMFGRMLAMAALGLARQAVLENLFAIPTFTVKLHDDELVWHGDIEGGAEDIWGAARRNPFGYRVPTDDEIASAWRYIENEYTLKEGNVDGEQWAEGLAFGRPIGELAKVDPSWHRELMAAAKHVRPQLTEDQWAMIAARADRLRADQGEVAKFRTAVKNPSIERDLGIDNPSGLTAKGERMYEDIKRGYGNDPRAKEIAARTVYARADEGVPGLVRNPRRRGVVSLKTEPEGYSSAELNDLIYEAGNVDAFFRRGVLDMHAVRKVAVKRGGHDLDLEKALVRQLTWMHKEGLEVS